jgi:hypothetical protein
LKPAKANSRGPSSTSGQYLILPTQREARPFGKYEREPRFGA